MAGMFDMIKQATSMRKQMKKMQKELAKKTVEETSGGVTVVARGDMSISDVRIDPSEFESPDRLKKSLVAAVNKALETAKKMAGDEMAKMSGGLGGLADMLGEQ